MFSLRKINTLLIILIGAILLYHTLLIVLGILGFVPYTPDFKTTGWYLLLILILHIIISMYLYLSNKSKQIKAYPKLIAETTYQYISGVCIIIFVIFHIVSHIMFPLSDMSRLNINLLHFMIEALLFVFIAVHLNISIPKFLVSLGFLESKNSYAYAKRITSFSVLILLILLIWVMFNFYLGGFL